MKNQTDNDFAIFNKTHFRVKSLAEYGNIFPSILKRFENKRKKKSDYMNVIISTKSKKERESSIFEVIFHI